MSFRKTTLLAVLAGALLLVAGAGAGTQTPQKIDLSSPAAIDAYLRSIGVDPASVVKQVGLQNYAGPNCPGPGWNCTTSTRVVQLSNEGGGSDDEGDNEVECKPKKDAVTGPSSCVIVQSGRNNHATCDEDDSAPTSNQVCTISQTNAKKNRALVEQEINQQSGSTQLATQQANVTQDPSEQNTSEIHQVVTQRISTGTPQSQDAFQEVNLTQDLNGNENVKGSENVSSVQQSQDQAESGNAGTQIQNTGLNPLGDCGLEKVANPNQCANVFQDANPGGGNNTSHLDQAIGEQQQSTSLTVSQTQGTSTGGQEGDVHQQNPQGVGQNVDLAHQALQQNQSSPNAAAPTQLEATDPGCCGISQVGGDSNTELIEQSTIQHASGPGAVQDATLAGQAHQEPAVEIEGPSAASPLSSGNTCEIDQHAENDSDTADFSASGNSAADCLTLTLDTNCNSPYGCFCEGTGPNNCPSEDFSAARAFGLFIARRN